jgi:hypothetical protein
MVLITLKSNALGDGVQCYCILAHELIASDGAKSESETFMLLYQGRIHFGMEASELQERMQRAQISSISAIQNYDQNILPAIIKDLRESNTPLRLSELYKAFEQLAWCDGLSPHEEKILDQIHSEWGLEDCLKGTGKESQGKAESLYSEFMKQNSSGCLVVIASTIAATLFSALA